MTDTQDTADLRNRRNDEACDVGPVISIPVLPVDRVIPRVDVGLPGVVDQRIDVEELPRRRVVVAVIGDLGTRQLEG